MSLKWVQELKPSLATLFLTVQILLVFLNQVGLSALSTKDANL